MTEINSSEERYKIIRACINMKDLYALIYIPIFIVIFWVLQVKDKEFFHGLPDIATIFLFVGIFHILASNVLAFLYNLNWVIFPFAPKVTPNALKAIGGIIVAISAFCIIRNFL